MKADIVVATSKNGVIGSNGIIPWKCPGDMKHFKDLTTGGVVIMGRLTYESIGKALPNRHNIVITRNDDMFRREKYDGKHRDITFCNNLKSAIKLGTSMGRTFIIGGGQVYDIAFEMNLVESVYLTTINDYIQGDVFFHLDSDWKPVKTLEENNNYDIKIFRRE